MIKTMKKINWKQLIISLLVCQLAGLVGWIFTSSSVNDWYAGLNKPVFNPPNWVFAPVWTTLFLLMGISLYIVWNSKDKKNKKGAVEMFSAQLLLNIGWSVFFFGIKEPLFAFIELLFLWAFIMLTMARFYRVSKTAAYLLLPYLLWVTFAAILNVAIAALN